MIVLIIIILVVLVSMIKLGPKTRPTGPGKTLYRVYTPSAFHQPLVIQCIQSYQPANTDLDFIIDTETGIRSAIGKAGPEDWRFVCSLYKAYLILIKPDMRLDVGCYGIATNNSSCYQLARSIGLNISLLDQEQIISGYGTSYAIYADLSSLGESDTIKTLSAKMASHLVPLPSSSAEVPMPFGAINLDDISRRYPKLRIHKGHGHGDLGLYYYTHNVPYILVAHRRVPNKMVEQVLGCLLYLMTAIPSEGSSYAAQEKKQVHRLMQGLTPVDINHNTLPVDTHPGARNIYRQVIDPIFGPS